MFKKILDYFKYFTEAEECEVNKIIAMLEEETKVNKIAAVLDMGLGISDRTQGGQVWGNPTENSEYIVEYMSGTQDVETEVYETSKDAAKRFLAVHDEFKKDRITALGLQFTKEELSVLRLALDNMPLENGHSVLEQLNSKDSIILDFVPEKDKECLKGLHEMDLAWKIKSLVRNR